MSNITPEQITAIIVALGGLVAAIVGAFQGIKAATASGTRKAIEESEIPAKLDGALQREAAAAASLEKEREQYRQTIRELLADAEENKVRAVLAQADATAAARAAEREAVPAPRAEPIDVVITGTEEVVPVRVDEGDLKEAAEKAVEKAAEE